MLRTWCGSRRLPRARQQGFEVRRFLFSVHDRHIEICETGLLKKASQFYPGEPEPNVGVEFPSLFDAVLQEIQNRDVASGP